MFRRAGTRAGGRAGKPAGVGSRTSGQRGIERLQPAVCALQHGVAAGDVVLGDTVDLMGGVGWGEVEVSGWRGGGVVVVVVKGGGGDGRGEVGSSLGSSPATAPANCGRQAAAGMQGEVASTRSTCVTREKSSPRKFLGSSASTFSKSMRACTGGRGVDVFNAWMTPSEGPNRPACWSCLRHRRRAGSESEDGAHEGLHCKKGHDQAEPSTTTTD